MEEYRGIWRALVPRLPHALRASSRGLEGNPVGSLSQDRVVYALRESLLVVEGDTRIPIKGHSNTKHGGFLLALSPDRFLTMGEDLHAWSLEGHLGTLSLTDAASVVALSPTRVLVISDVTRVWDVVTGKSTQLDVDWDRSPSSRIAVLDPSRVVIAVPDHRLQVWDVTTGTRVRELGESEQWHCVATLSPTEVVASANRRLQIWNVETGACRRLRGKTSEFPHVRPVNRNLVLVWEHRDPTRDTRLHVWSMSMGSEILRFPVAAGSQVQTFFPDSLFLVINSRCLVGEFDVDGRKKEEELCRARKEGRLPPELATLSDPAWEAFLSQRCVRGVMTVSKRRKIE